MDHSSDFFRSVNIHETSIQHFLRRKPCFSFYPFSIVIIVCENIFYNFFQSQSAKLPNYEWPFTRLKVFVIPCHNLFRKIRISLCTKFKTKTKTKNEIKLMDFCRILGTDFRILVTVTTWSCSWPADGPCQPWRPLAVNFYLKCFLKM